MIQQSVASHSYHLQQHKHQLETWESKWDVQFNSLKCQVIQITKRKTRIPTQYSLHNTILGSVSSAKYLGVTFSENLTCNTSHIDNKVKKANQTLGFLRRNIKVHSEPFKGTAYKTRVRPKLKYSSCIWSLYTPELSSTRLSLCSAGLHAGSKMTIPKHQVFLAMLDSLGWRSLSQSKQDISAPNQIGPFRKIGP
jgi:hypothetical protein